MDGIVKGAQKKKCKPVQAQKKVSNTNKKEILKIIHIFWKKNVRFIIIGITILIIVSVGASIFVFKKKKVPVNDKKYVSVQKNVTSVTKNDSEPQESNVFHITIDTEGFKVNADIIEGKTDEDLHKGVIHQEGSAFPSQYGGNVVITGHRWYPGDGEFSKVFQNIDKLKKDDKIIIEYKGKKYIYSVRDWSIVETTDTKFLEHTSESQLTIYTCHPKFTSKQRLVYIANLDSVEDAQ